MKKRHWFLAAAVLVVGALVAWLARPSEGPPAPPLDLAARNEPVAPAATVLEVAADVPRTEADAGAQAPAVVAATAPSESDAIVLGRVVDEAGAGIAGAELRFSAMDTWATGRVVPHRIVEGRRVEEYVTRSGDDGRFRFEIAVPTAEYVSLFIEAGPFRSVEYRSFGVGRRKPLRRIAAGTNELGDIVLTTAGAVRGRVLGTDGTSIAGAEFVRDGRGSGVGERSTDRGTYELEHLQPGTCSISVSVDGWRSAKIEGVVVVAGRATDGVDFALARASSISGVVVDQHGAPAVDVLIWGWPKSGEGNGARTDSAGHFTLFLPQHEAYDLEAKDNAAFEDWGLARTEAETYAPGTDDARIVLTRK